MQGLEHIPETTLSDNGHYAMTMIDSDDGESGTVYSEARRGYLMNGKLLRAALVAVLK